MRQEDDSVDSYVSRKKVTPNTNHKRKDNDSSSQQTSSSWEMSDNSDKVNDSPDESNETRINSESSFKIRTTTALKFANQNLHDTSTAKKPKQRASRVRTMPVAAGTFDSLIM